MREGARLSASPVSPRHRYVALLPLHMTEEMTSDSLSTRVAEVVNHGQAIRQANPTQQHRCLRASAQKAEADVNIFEMNDLFAAAISNRYPLDAKYCLFAGDLQGAVICARRAD